MLGILLLMLASAGFSQDSVWLARTTGKLPFMEYGIGDDRLGGAKIGYLDSNILVRITDSFNTDYKVRLSAYHSAYIAKSSVLLIGRQANLPVAERDHSCLSDQARLGCHRETPARNDPSSLSG